MTMSHGSDPRSLRLPCGQSNQDRRAPARQDRRRAVSRQRANLCANLAGSAKQKNAHPSRTLRRQATAAGGVMFRQERLPPGAIVDVPLHRRQKPRFKCVPRLPAEFGLQLRTINRITEVVAGTVGDKGDQFAMRSAVVVAAQACPACRRSS